MIDEMENTAIFADCMLVVFPMNMNQPDIWIERLLARVAEIRTVW